MKMFLRLYIIPIALGAAMLFGLMTQCNRQTEKMYNATEVTSALNKQKLELTTKYLQQLSDSSEVIQQANKKLSDKLRPIIIYKTAKTKASVEIARKDTNTSVIANTAINDQETLIFDLDLKSYSDSIQIAECMRRHVFKDSIASELRAAFDTEVMVGIEKDKAVRKKERANKVLLFFGKVVVVVETVLLILR